MRLEHLAYLCSPKNQRSLKLLEFEMEDDRVRSGILSDGENQWPIVDFIPRFVAAEEDDSFSIQWTNHPQIMHEAFSGLTLYKERFTKETRWENDLTGQLVLEAGCGVGSFTRPALDTNALVVSFDISAGVDINYQVNGENPNLLICQASVYEMPFPSIFDKVFCFGVLQHTPDPRESFRCLIEELKPNGKISTDIYADVPFTYRHGLVKTKYFLRKWTASMERRKLYQYVKIYVKLLWPICQLLQKLPGGLILSQHLMIDRYSDRLTNMRPELYKEYAIIEIFDMLSPSHDNPQTIEDYCHWHEELGLENIDVHYGYNGIEGRGTTAQDRFDVSVTD